MTIKPLFRVLSSVCLCSICFISSASTNCVVEKRLDNIPPDRLETHKKALTIVEQHPIDKGSTEYYEKLYHSSKYIYVGYVSLILTKNEQLVDSNKVDGDLAFITISKGWKRGKVKKSKLTIPEKKELCNDLYAYQLKAKSNYLFFEDHRKLITALPLDKNLDFKGYGKDALTHLGEIDWYYARNSTIHYSNK